VRILPNSPTPQLPVVAATPRRIRGEPAQALRERAGEGWLVAARALIDGLLDAVWLVDPDNLHIVAANRAAGELVGVEAGSLCGQDMLTLAATPEDMAFWQEAALGWTDSVESHTWVRRVDDSLVTVHRRVTRMVLPPEKAVFMVVMHDRSRERRAEDELADRLAELAATLESTQDGILVTDTSGRIRNFNQRFAAMWELPENLLSQRDDDAILSWMLRRVVEPAEYMRRLAAIDGLPQTQSSDTITLIGGRVLERVTLPQCSRGQTIGRVYSFRDITRKPRSQPAHRPAVAHRRTDRPAQPPRAAQPHRVRAGPGAARGGPRLPLLFLNLDRFKHINDTPSATACRRPRAGRSGQAPAVPLRQVDTVARLGATST
jgi:PAS domain-containing protein